MEGAPLTTLLFQGGSPRGRFAGSPQGAAPARSAPLIQERRGAPSPPTLPPHNHSLLCCCPIGQGGSPNGPPQSTRPTGASSLRCALRACCRDGGYAPANKKKARTPKDPLLENVLIHGAYLPDIYNSRNCLWPLLHFQHLIMLRP